ncbi:uncharacterized protein BP01DRAFT_415450 [Aspergillus saccharolyticus JOP 1030-1]|uniref:Phytanoyl-CoA dioxygenase family protein n=1 Tax=Aspergillus saccharolyticus JOP 1030-1 TaxID=1450539 RepID=A0A318ZPV9_9EURO|nr:hypothetical protein BP01DRAFT_415450 [Aspergillus saccharolyticus JOP 1030-1]PYH45960.1 hypothetical protein BP01DRAFT_415450 [Aspergillus saccharolyticus JOP 1030-1]
MTQSHIERIPYSAPRGTFIDALKREGCVIVQNFSTPETLEQARQEVQPWLEKEEHRSKLGGRLRLPALNGGTRTCTRLIGRSQTVREKFFSDLLDLAEEFLAITTTNWYGEEPSTNITHPLLSIAITMDIRPGARAQKLHRDDKNHHARHTRVDAYHTNRDILLGLFVPGCDTRRANGATRVVLGSHLWGDEKPDFGPDGNTGVFFESSGGRMMHIMFMCSGVYRQESKLVQQRLGWTQSGPNLGWVDLASPDALL